LATPAEADGELPAVLVVDDNEDAAEMLSALLGSVGHRVETACDGPSALRRLDRAWPDIAILDIGLPGMDGYELAGRIRQLAAARGQSISLVALSGYGQDSDVRRALAAGFDRHIAKPVSLGTLQELFRALAPAAPD
jgi:CheY-like chemotaxis protein